MQAGRLRILFVVPFPPRLGGTHGGAKAIGELLLRSADRHDVGVAYLRHADEPEPERELLERVAVTAKINRPNEPTGLPHVLRALRRRVGLLAGTPLWVSELASPGTTDRVREIINAWRPDVIRLDYPVSAALVPRAPRSAATVLVDYDPLLAQAQSATSARERLELALDRRAWRRFDLRSRKAADAVVVLTERDRRVVAEAGGARLLASIPLGIEPLPALDSSGKDDDSLLFVGNLNHPANRDAVAHLVDDIIPRIHARHHDVLLTVVGQQQADKPFHSATEAVGFTGLVEDVVPFLNDAAIVLAPLRTGSGMRVKVLEALSAGKAVVAYPLALEGIDVEPGRQVIVATSPGEFTHAVLELLGNPELRAEIGHSARAWALENAGWDRVLDAWDELYARVLDRRGSDR
jgi:polysaccharide biosynthesis protein PslH